MQDEGENEILLPVEIWLNILNLACSEYFDLFTFKNVRLTCHTMKELIDEHVPYRVLESYSIENEEDRNYFGQTKITTRCGFNKLIQLTHPRILYVICYLWETCNECAFEFESWWNRNSCSWSFIVNISDDTYEQKGYVPNNMLLIVLYSQPLTDDRQTPLSFWKLVDQVLQKSGHVVYFYCPYTMEQDNNRPIPDAAHFKRYPVSFLNLTHIPDNVLWPDANVNKKLTL